MSPLREATTGGGFHHAPQIYFFGNSNSLVAPTSGSRKSARGSCFQLPRARLVFNDGLPLAYHGYCWHTVAVGWPEQTSAFNAAIVLCCCLSCSCCWRICSCCSLTALTS